MRAAHLVTSVLLMHQSLTTSHHLPHGLLQATIISHQDCCSSLPTLLSVLPYFSSKNRAQPPSGSQGSGLPSPPGSPPFPLITFPLALLLHLFQPLVLKYPVDSCPAPLLLLFPLPGRLSPESFLLPHAPRLSSLLRYQLFREATLGALSKPFCPVSPSPVLFYFTHVLVNVYHPLPAPFLRYITT